MLASHLAAVCAPQATWPRSFVTGFDRVEVITGFLDQGILELLARLTSKPPAGDGSPTARREAGPIVHATVYTELALHSAVTSFLSHLLVPSFPNHRLFGGRVPIVA